MKILARTKGMSTHEWLQCRRYGICGSDSPIILGLSKYRSVLQLWKDKTGQIPIEETESEYAYWGHVMETTIRKEFMKRTGLKVRIRNQILQSEEYPFMLADVDGVVKEADGSYALFEAKTASEYKRKIWEEGVPEEYIAQVQHYLCVTGYKKAYVCAVVGGNTFFCHVIYRDEEYIEDLVEKERNFWNYVMNSVPPALDGSQATTDYLNESYPVSIKAEMELPPDAEALAASFISIEEKMKALTEEKNLVANQLKGMMQDNEKGYAGSHVVNWPTIQKRSLDSKKVKEMLGNRYEDYLVTSSYRKFSVA